MDHVVIPISSMEELKSYQKGILGVLSKVELNNCDESLREDLKSVYKLLRHLLTNDHSKLTTSKPKAHERQN